MRSSPPVPERAGDAHDARTPARLFLAAVIVFIVYGSLFPFDFASQAVPIARFYAEYALFDNRADAIDNFFLFVPLGIGLHLSFRHAPARFAAALLAVLVLALGIQLAQLYLPSRTASLADAFWNSFGVGAGLLVASRVGAAVRGRLSLHAAGRDYFLACLVALWFLYEAFPFLPTLDVGLLRAHVKSAVFAPPFEFMRLAQHAMAAALAGVAMTRAGMLRRPLPGVAALGALALALEVAVAYGSLRRETLLGIVLGLAAGYLAAQRLRARSHDIAFAVALCALLVTVLTPYRAQAPDAGFTFTPFSHLLWQGIVKHVPPYAFEALAIGTMLWSGMAGRQRFRDHPRQWCAIVVLLVAALEWVRVAVAGFHGDTSTVVMALLLAPAAVALRLPGEGAAAPRAAVRDDGATGAAGAAAAPAAPRALMLFGAAAAAIAAAMWLVLQLPGIPYSLNKLFGQHALLGSAAFSLVLLWLGSGPWMAARMVLELDRRRRHGALWTPLLVVGLALVSFALLNLAVPGVMLEKVVGAPDLYRRIVDENYWGEAWRAGLAAWPRGLVSAAERLVRYVALYAVFAIPLVAGLLALPRHERRPRVLVNLLYLLPCWLLAKVVVLDWAITDNLTELVADGGALFLAAAIALFALNAVALVAHAGRPRRFPALAAATAALVGASWWLLNEGIETVVVNHGRIFGGLQFLLGENRTELLSAPALFLRWSVVYCAGLTVVVAGMLLAQRVLPLPAAPAARRR